MDRNPQRPFCWWLIVYFSFFTLTESRLVYVRGSGATNSVPIRTISDSQHPLTVIKQQQGAEPSARPPPVVVHCHPDSMEVVVQADMFDRGLRVDGRHLRLGSEIGSEGSGCRLASSSSSSSSREAEFTIRSHLMECGTKLSSTKDKIIYSNMLVYSPKPSSDGLLRLDGATIPLECRYEKRYNVGGIPLQPTWVPLVSRVSAEKQIHFNLLLKTDDWQFKRGSYSYFLGDPIHFELSAVISNHIPLRVYVDHCIATATPNVEAPLTFSFIERHGCLVEAYLTNSSSHFLPRAEEHKLKFQLDAFRFFQEPTNQVYISCYVKAVPVVLTLSSQNRACSFIGNRWRSIDGKDQVCSSCDVFHHAHEFLSTELPKTMAYTKARPSITPYDRFSEVRPEQQHTAAYFRFHPHVDQNQHNKQQQSSPGLRKRGAEYKALQAIQLGPITVLP